MLAAVFFIMNLGNPDSGTTSVWVRALEAAVAMAAMSFYGALTLQASRSLANPAQLMGDEEVEFKKRQTKRVLGNLLGDDCNDRIPGVHQGDGPSVPRGNRYHRRTTVNPTISQQEDERARSTSPTEDPPPADKQQGDEPAEHGGASPDGG